ncbi:MAG: NADP-dependent oxidoreductase [Pseudomonadota bacterium]
MTANHQILFASRPEGMPEASNFDYQPIDVPTPGEGEMLLRMIFLSVDPYMRGRMILAKSYAAPFELGEPIYSGGVAEVMESNGGKFEKGAIVGGIMNWREYQTHDGSELTQIPNSGLPYSYALGALGMPGMTAWAGLNLHGKPKEGETLVVSAASGAVGAMVAQMGKAKGLRVVGVAGGAEKCAYVTDELGADACVDHRDPDLNKKLKEACPDGVDIYFENVGGATLDAVIPLFNPFARMPLCGMIAHYNDLGAPTGPDRAPALMRALLTMRVTVRGFIVTDHWNQFPEFLAETAPQIAAGKIKVKETVTDGLENAPSAFISLLSGGNFGKQIVRVGDDP